MTFTHIIIFVLVAILEFRTNEINKKINEKEFGYLLFRILAVTIILTWAVQTLFGSRQQEGFHFEVTPWKTQRLENPDCPQCCGRGFTGIPIGFEYTGDSGRLNECTTCPTSPEINRENNFASLKTYNDLSSYPDKH